MNEALTSMIVMLFTLACFACFAPLASAETYFYVDQEGIVREVTAADAYTALTLATDRDVSTGLMLDMSAVEPGLVVEQAIDAIGGPQMDLPVSDYSSWGLYDPDPDWGASHIPTMNWNGLMPGSWGSYSWW